MLICGIGRLLRCFGKDRRGGAAILIGLTLPMFVGFLGLGVDVTNWYLSKRMLQTAVDSAVISAALTYSYTDDLAAARDAAADSAGRNDFTVGSGTTMAVNFPPTQGAYTGDDAAVEVIATWDQVVYLASVIFGDDVTVRARAVATLVGVPSEHCVLGLDPDFADTVEFTGNSNFTVNCGVASNSHSDEALTIWGNADIISTPVSTVGDIAVGGSGQLQSAAPLRSFQSPFLDPYGPKGRDLGTYGLMPSECTFTSLHLDLGIDTPLNPGRFCDGLKISDTNVTFSPGTYIIDGGDFTVSGTSTLIGDGVTFVLTGSGTDYATVKFSGGTIADLTAPTDGPFDGILFYQDADAPSFKGNTMISNTFLGGSEMVLTGALYFPSQEIVYTGGANLGGVCIQIIGRKVTFTGSGTIGFDCPNDMDIGPIVSLRVKLVE